MRTQPISISPHLAAIAIVLNLHWHVFVYATKPTPADLLLCQTNRGGTSECENHDKNPSSPKTLDDLAPSSQTDTRRDDDAKFGVKRISDQTYQDLDESAGKCDVFLPDPLPDHGKLPCVILVHGGGWVGGDKRNLRNYAHQLTKNGFVCLTINYRHAPQYPFPAQVDDVRLAMLWLKDQQSRFKIDMDRLGMFGYSAGGHLTALVSSVANRPMDVQCNTSDWRIDDPRWKDLPRIKAICIGGPPCDFQRLPLDNTSMKFFLGDSRRNSPDVYLAASPLAHVSQGDPPTMIIHGESDIMVPLRGSQIFHQAQIAAGISSQLTILPKQGHLLTFINPQTVTQMIRHFKAQLGR